jgi:hypothetical protein
VYVRRSGGSVTLACFRPAGLDSPGGEVVDEIADRLLELIHGLEEVTDTITPQWAHEQFDETTLQVFWKRWPYISAWAGSLWRMLSEELSGPATPQRDPELDEVGEGG